MPEYVKREFRIDRGQLQKDLIDLSITNPDGSRLDAGETGFIAKQLEYVMAQTYDIMYGPLQFRTFLPVNNEVPTGAETFSYDQWSLIGLAKIITSWSDAVPDVSAFVARFTADVKHLALKYSYSFQDIRAIQLTRGRLNDQKASAVRLGIESALNVLAFSGDSNRGLLGFFNQTAIPIVTANFGNWNETTAVASILSDVKKLVNTQKNNTKRQIKGDTLLVSTGDWTIIQRTVGAELSKTIMQVILDHNPDIKNIDQAEELDTAGADGHSRMVFYKRDKTVVEFVIPQEFEQMPPTTDGFNTEVKCHASLGGISMKYPLGAAYMDTHPTI